MCGQGWLPPPQCVSRALRASCWFSLPKHAFTSSAPKSPPLPRGEGGSYQHIPVSHRTQQILTLTQQPRGVQAASGAAGQPDLRLGCLVCATAAGLPRSPRDEQCSLVLRAAARVLVFLLAKNTPPKCCELRHETHRTSADFHSL